MITLTSNRRERIEELRKAHERHFNHLGMHDAYFVPKVAFIPKGKTSKHIALFPSELEKGDVYLEFASKEFVPEDDKRTLYKWSYRDNWSDYEQYGIGNSQYIVPLTDLKEIGDIETNYNLHSQGLVGETKDPLQSILDMTVREVLSKLINK